MSATPHDEKDEVEKDEVEKDEVEKDGAKRDGVKRDGVKGQPGGNGYLDGQEEDSFPASDPHSDWSGPPERD